MQPGQQKITQFDEVTSTQSGDIIPIVRGGQNKKISVENFTGVLPEGWLTPAEAWTFASFGNGVGVITIPEGNINRYPNGTRVWFKQGTPTATDRYGVVIGSTTTALTVAMIAGTTLQNLTIQQPAVSSEIAPRTPQNTDFMNMTLGTDANGWLVKIMPNYKRRWWKVGNTGNFTWPGTTGTSWASRTLSSLPVGAGDAATLHVMGAVAGADNAINASLRGSGVVLAAQSSNMYTSSVTTTLHYNVTLEEV